MTVNANTANQVHQNLPKINTITTDEPKQWLKKGWIDFKKSFGYSILFGIFYMLFSYLMTIGLFQSQYFHLMPPLLILFFLIVPMLGIGLYELSRKLEKKEKLVWCFTRDAWKRNSGNLMAMGFILMAISLFWMMIAILIFALFYGQTFHLPKEFLWSLIFSEQNFPFIFFGSLAGLLIAFFTFSITVISVPMLMDRKIDLIIAIKSSRQAVKQNMKPMLLWASLIILLTAIGFATLYIGLIIIIPIIGHASWHAYRDLVTFEK